MSEEKPRVNLELDVRPDWMPVPYEVVRIEEGLYKVTYVLRLNDIQEAIGATGAMFKALQKYKQPEGV